MQAFPCQLSWQDPHTRLQVKSQKGSNPLSLPKLQLEYSYNFRQTPVKISTVRLQTLYTQTLVLVDNTYT